MTEEIRNDDAPIEGDNNEEKIEDTEEIGLAPLEEETKPAEEPAAVETLPEKKPARKQKKPLDADGKKRLLVAGILAVVGIILLGAFGTFSVLAVRKLQENPEFSWTSMTMVAIYATIVIIAVFVAAVFIQKKVKEKKNKRYNPKDMAYLVCLALLAMISFWTWIAIAAMRQSDDFSWTSPKMIALYFAAGIMASAVIVFVLLMRRATTRWEMEERLSNDDDIHDWLVIFNWTKKILHLPTVAVSFLAAVIVWLWPETAKVVGAIWFCVWLFCHIIEDNNIGLAVAVALGGVILLFTVLAIFGGVLDEIVDMARMISIAASPALYIGFGLAYLASIGLSYIKGLFYYVALEPNQMIVQFKIGEDGETFQRMQYDARVEATVDIFEWMIFDTATIKIQFRDGKRSPMEYYVGKIRKKARYLSNVLGVTAIDRTKRSSGKS